jgi:hypothetical protein
MGDSGGEKEPQKVTGVAGKPTSQESADFADYADFSRELLSHAVGECNSHLD